jgi:hypothetical protein
MHDPLAVRRRATIVEQRTVFLHWSSNAESQRFLPHEIEVELVDPRFTLWTSTLPATP